ncbi:MAG TPA: phage/plasmid primase, P4 family [Pirellulaceae bacterium]|nr:phage/plasmid primase, P4 family [Pirellulaceae bacterium]
MTARIEKPRRNSAPLEGLDGELAPETQQPHCEWQGLSLAKIVEWCTDRELSICTDDTDRIWLQRGDEKFDLTDAELHAYGAAIAAADAAEEKQIVTLERSNRPEDKPLDLTVSPNRTELGLARRFVTEHEGNLRYCPLWKKWLVWDGKRWVTDDGVRVLGMAQATVERMWHQITTIQRGDGGPQGMLVEMDGRQRQAIIAFAIACHENKHLAAMLKLAQARPGISVLPDELDSHPWLFNVANGTIDLRTGQLREHCRDDLLTKLCPHDYDPTAKCPLWIATLAKIFERKRELIGFLQRFVGMALIGEVVEELLVIWYGDGNNGKTLVAEILMDMFGSDYACAAMPTLLMESRGDRHLTERADLFGKRLVVCSETEAGCRLAEAAMKLMTGRGRIKARRMREDPWEFPPSHSFVLDTNNKPIIDGTDEGVWRRPLLLPFLVKFWREGKDAPGPPELKADVKRYEDLQAEMPGILALAVRGCLSYQRHGLSAPSEVREATDEYRDEQNRIADFLEECCTRSSAGQVRVQELYDLYCVWARKGAMNLTRFGQAMAKLGFKRKRSNGVWYVGIAATAKLIHGQLVYSPRWPDEADLDTQ